MIGSGMTILMGAYSGDWMDVAIISDRRATPSARGLAEGVPRRENVYKTLRLGPQVAIGFCGAAPLSNRILAWLLQEPEPDVGVDLLCQLVEREGAFNHSFTDMADGLSAVTKTAVKLAAAPDTVDVAAIVAGCVGGTPMFLELNAATEWKARPSDAKSPWCKPNDMIGDNARAEFIEYIATRPGLDYIASLKAAVEFCADRYDSVNHNYVLRRLQTGFAREEGRVQPGASLHS